MKKARPTDDRMVLPLSQEEINAAKQAKNDHERMKIHRLLLTESMRRLRAGRTLERDHGVIHPEMTAITRDVLRLTDLVFPGSKPVEDEAPAELNKGATLLCELVDRSSPAKLGKITGIAPAVIRRWAAGTELPDEARRVQLETRLKIPRGAWDERGAA